MLRNLLKNKNKKGQNTAEYALLIALVVAGVIAMQTYAQRTLQARMHDASQYLTSQTSTIGNATQYEPYYLQSNYNIDRESEDGTILGKGLAAKYSSTNRTRQSGGSQVSVYNGTIKMDATGGSVSTTTGSSF